MGRWSLASILLAGLAIYGGSVGAMAQTVERLFPFSATSAQDAMGQCRTLLDPAQLTMAARGALVTISAGAGASRQSIVIASEEVSRFASELPRPRSRGHAAVNIVSSSQGEVAIVAHLVDAPEFAVGCRYQFLAGAMRLVSIDLPLSQRSR